MDDATCITPPVSVVVGANGGIGSALCRRSHRGGHQVVRIGRDVTQRGGTGPLQDALAIDVCAEAPDEAAFAWHQRPGAFVIHRGRVVSASRHARASDRPACEALADACGLPAAAEGGHAP